MISLKMSKERVLNHMAYSKWWYIITLALTLVIFNFAYSVTAPRVPDWLKIDITVYGKGYLDSAGSKDWEAEMLEITDIDQKEVNLMSMSLGTNEGETYQMMEVLAARMAAREDDILVLPTIYAQTYMKQGAFIALEDYFSIDDIENLPEEIEISNYYGMIEDGVGNDAKEHLFILPLDGAERFYELGINPSGMSIMILIYTENIDNAIKCVDFIINQTGQDKNIYN